MCVCVRAQMKEVRKVRALRERLNEVSAKLYHGNKELLSIKQPKLRRPFMADVEKLEDDARSLQEQLAEAVEAAKPDRVIARLQAEAKDSSIKFVRSIFLRQLHGELGARVSIWRAALECFQRDEAKRRDEAAERASAQAHQDFVAKLHAQKTADDVSSHFEAQQAVFEKAAADRNVEVDQLQTPLSALQVRGHTAGIKQLRAVLQRIIKRLLPYCVFVWRKR